MEINHLDGMPAYSFNENGVSTGPDAPDNVLFLSRAESGNQQNQLQNMGNCKSPVVSQAGDDSSVETNPKVSKLTEDPDEKVAIPVVQQRGRFKVTSESVGLEKVASSPVLTKSHSVQAMIQLPASSLPSPSSPFEAVTNHGSSLFPHLHYILQANII